MAVSILIVAGNTADTTKASDALSRAGFRVEVVGDGSAGAAKLSRTPFDVIVVDWLLPDLDGPAFVRQFRTLHPRTPFILLSALTGPMARRQSEKVGAFDLVSKPVTSAALVRAVSAALGRSPPPSAPDVPDSGPISKRDSPPSSGGTPSPPPSSSSSSSSSLTSVSASSSSGSTVPLLQARGWRNAVETVRNTLAANIGVDVTITRTRADLGEIHASLSMIAAEQLVEIGLALVVHRASGIALAKQMLHSTSGDDATVRELLMELCNGVLGALKTEMRESGYSFTLGLPKPMESASAAAVRAAFTGSTVTTFAAGESEISAILGARQSIPVAVLVSRLEEGNVIAQDVYAGSNTLMISAGTRLTATTIQRLLRQLPNRTVRVCKML